MNLVFKNGMAKQGVAEGPLPFLLIYPPSVSYQIVGFSPISKKWQGRKRNKNDQIELYIYYSSVEVQILAGAFCLTRVRKDVPSFTKGGKKYHQCKSSAFFYLVTAEYPWTTDDPLSTI